MKKPIKRLYTVIDVRGEKNFVRAYSYKQAYETLYWRENAFKPKKVQLYNNWGN